MYVSSRSNYAELVATTVVMTAALVIAVLTLGRTAPTWEIGLIVATTVVYWLAGTAVSVNAPHRRAYGIMVLALNSIALLVALTTLVAAESATGVSIFTARIAATALPPLIARAYSIFEPEGSSAVVVRVLDVAAVVLVAVIVVGSVEDLAAPALEAPVALGVGAGIAVAFVTLVRAAVRERRPRMRSRMLLLMVASAVSAAVLFVGTAVRTEVAHAFWLIGTWPLPLAVVGAVLGGGLADIEVRRSFVKLLVAALIAASVVGLVLVTASTTVPHAFLVVTSSVALVGLVPGVRAAWSALDRLAYKDHYDFRRLTTEFTELLDVRSASSMAQFVASRLTSALNLRGAALLGRDGAVLGQAGDPAGAEDAIWLPLGDRGIGKLLLVRRRSTEPFRQTDIDLIRVVVHQTTLVLEKVELVTRLAGQIDALESERSLRRLLHAKLLRAEEETRARISRDLHDGALQSVMHMARIADAEPDDHSALTTLADLAQDVSAELRAVCNDLRPPGVEFVGLGAALKEIARRFRVDHSVSVSVELTPGFLRRPLPVEVEDVLFRVASEAMTNAVRHGRADRILVRVDASDSELTLDVIDSGTGLISQDRVDDLRGLAAMGHIGIIGMKERLSELDGRLSIRERMEGGTALRAVVPASGGAATPVTRAPTQHPEGEDVAHDHDASTARR